MKYLFSILASFSLLCAQAQTIKQGDNLQAEYRKLDKPYFFKAPKFTPWIEGRDMLFIAGKPNLKDCDFVFLALQDTSLIGVFKASEAYQLPVDIEMRGLFKSSKNGYFLFDTEGDSLLHGPTDFFLLPLWTVKRQARIDSSDNTILSILDRLYETTMQADNGQPAERTIRKYQQFQTNKSLANRHIALLFDNYQTIITETAAKGQKPPSDVCVPLMKSLARECIELYHQIPAIVCVYLGEALQSAGMIELARAHYKTTLQFYPNSIPLLVYNYQLEEDPVKKDAELARLKKQHPNHWMVKGL